MPILLADALALLGLLTALSQTAPGQRRLAALKQWCWRRRRRS